jgi:hypothetical protein
MADPGTTPPPQTRSHSSTPVAMRGGAAVAWSEAFEFQRLLAGGLVALSAPGGRLASSSTSEFQAPQAGHCPLQRVCTAPQD